MLAPLPLRCACGALQGAYAAPLSVNRRGRCYCKDCQAYAQWLGTPGIMDERGGSEVAPGWPSQVTLTAGADRPALVRLTEKGLYRWYAGCCRTPVANTISPKLPFVGVLRNFIAATDAELDARFGPATGVQGRFAVGGCPPGAHASASFAIIAASIGLLTSGYWAGGARPTPFFREDGTPVTQAYVLTASEREALPR